MTTEERERRELFAVFVAESQELLAGMEESIERLTSDPSVCSPLTSKQENSSFHSGPVPSRGLS